MLLNEYHIFISHSWTYGDVYNRLITMLNYAPHFLYKDYSVPKEDPIHSCGSDFELYMAIKRQISPCDVVLILAGVYSTYSKWINKEIHICKNGFSTVKPIIGVAPWGAERISSIVRDNADTIVNWNTNSIVDAIREYAI